jgi:putative inorganic carbon (HCO3(-)) transporter
VRRGIIRRLVSLARLARGLLPAATVVAALLVVAPGLDAPFSGPKRVVLFAAAACALLLAPWSRRRVAWPLLVPVVAAAASAALGAYAAREPAWTQLAFAALAFAWASSGVDATWLVPAAVGSGGVVTVVALLQAVGVDPFTALAPRVEGGRLGVFSTLGNPDFVASALSVVLCLAVGAWARTPRRREYLLGAGLLLAALAVTRSFATLAALGVALITALVHRRGQPRSPTGNAGARGWIAAVALVGLVALAAPLAGRSLADAAQGRVYLWRVTAPHALDAPMVGLGPGALEALWPGWEVEWWRARCGADATCVAEHPAFRFAALQDHAHNDWLEALVERGLVGLSALVLLFAVSLRRAWRSPAPLATATVAALVVTAARAALDFPLARPADLCLLAAVVGLAFSLEDA